MLTVNRDIDLRIVPVSLTQATILRYQQDEHGSMQLDVPLACHNLEVNSQPDMILAY